MKKFVIGLLTVGFLASTGFIGGVQALADTTTEPTAVADTLTMDDATLQAEIQAALVELEALGFLAEQPTGELAVTDKYVSVTQETLGANFEVTAEGNVLTVTERTPATMQTMRLFGAGETKIVYTSTSIDVYLDHTLCLLLGAGFDISGFLAELIPVPVLNTVIAKIINVSKNLLLAQDTGYGVIVSIKVFKDTYVPYFVTIHPQLPA